MKPTDDFLPPRVQQVPHYLQCQTHFFKSSQNNYLSGSSSNSTRHASRLRPGMGFTAGIPGRRNKPKHSHIAGLTGRFSSCTTDNLSRLGELFPPRPKVQTVCTELPQLQWTTAIKLWIRAWT